MKKLWSTLAFLAFALSGLSALDGVVTWTWYENDPDVQFYRYQVDSEEEGGWTVLDRTVKEITLKLDVSAVHTLYLQQSRDGELWSASSWTDSEIYEEKVPEEPIEEEPAPVIIEIDGVDSNISSEGPDASEGSSIVIEEPVYDSLKELDFGFGYMNSVPDPKGPKTLGGFAAYSMTFIKVRDLFDVGFKSNAALYIPKGLFIDAGNSGLYSYANALALMTTRIGRCDLYIALGPELGLTLINDPKAHFGLAAELGIRYHRFRTMSLGLVLSDHYYMAPSSDMANRFDVRVYLSKDM